MQHFKWTLPFKAGLINFWCGVGSMKFNRYTSSRDSNGCTYPLNASSRTEISWDLAATRQEETDVDPRCQEMALPSGDMHASWVVLLAGCCQWLGQWLEVLPANKIRTVSDGLKFYTLTRRGKNLFIMVFWFYTLYNNMVLLHHF